MLALKEPRPDVVTLKATVEQALALADGLDLKLAALHLQRALDELEASPA